MLTETELIEGTHLILNQAEAGFEGTAYVYIALEGQDRKTLSSFEAAIIDVPQIQECYLLAGRSDSPSTRSSFATCKIWNDCTRR